MCKALGNHLKPMQRSFHHSFQKGMKRPLKFDPTDECVASEQQRRKKAVTPGKGRPKQLQVVILEDIPPTIPKGIARDHLRKENRIKNLHFYRSMSVYETMNIITEAFKDINLKGLKFLQAYKSNCLREADEQALDGAGVIKLAGCGSLYLTQVISSSATSCSLEGTEEHPAIVSSESDADEQPKVTISKLCFDV